MQQQGRLSPGPHIQFTEYSRYVRLDGRFGNAEFISDLFVQQTLADHRQDTELLRCQAGKPFTGSLRLIGNADGLERLRRPEHVAIKYRTHGFLDHAQITGFGNKTAGAELTGLDHDRSLFLGGDHDHRNLRVLTA
ncbi:hypothetical protein D3C84_922750 [compost metagenome]